MKSQLKNTNQTWAVLGFILVAVASRCLPHPSNTTPMVGMALFAGAYSNQRKIIYSALFLAMFVSDWILGFHALVPVVYGSFALILFFSQFFLRRPSPLRIGAAAVLSSTFFFIVTNFFVWAFSGMYPLNFDGLLGCYVLALPFFTSMLVGDILFTALLFGGFATASKLTHHFRFGLLT